MYCSERAYSSVAKTAQLHHFLEPNAKNPRSNKRLVLEPRFPNPHQQEAAQPPFPPLPSNRAPRRKPQPNTPTPFTSQSTNTLR